MPTVYLGLGSNIGDRAAHLAFALRRLADAFSLTGVSSVWETDPVGYVDQGRFLNLVARVETDASPREVLETAVAIERARGRERTFRNAPRTLDIDVLLYGDAVVDEDGEGAGAEGLEVPHPRMRERPFVLVPLLELEPGLVDPATGAAYGELAAARPSPGMERVMAAKELLDEGGRDGQDADESSA